MILTSRRAAVAVATLGLVAGGTGAAFAGQQHHRDDHGRHHGGHGHHHGHHGHHQGGSAEARSGVDGIPNLGVVKSQIEAYYDNDGDDRADPDSAYAHDVYQVERRAAHKLPRLIAHADGNPVVVVDVDDTTLLTYNYEATHDFGYDAEENADYIATQDMRSVFGMVRLLNYAVAQGADVYYVTGRPEEQRGGTVDDLVLAGYPQISETDSSHLYLNDHTCEVADDVPCSTVQRKSRQRAEIESLNGGQDIVLNMGDQFSDLKGGYADYRLKMPNPMYFLP